MSTRTEKATPQTQPPLDGTSIQPFAKELLPHTYSRLDTVLNTTGQLSAGGPSEYNATIMPIYRLPDYLIFYDLPRTNAPISPEHSAAQYIIANETK